MDVAVLALGIGPGCKCKDTHDHAGHLKAAGERTFEKDTSAQVVEHPEHDKGHGSCADIAADKAKLIHDFGKCFHRSKLLSAYQ
jgi:hypothetical protein